MTDSIFLSMARMSGYEQLYMNEDFEMNWVLQMDSNMDAFVRYLTDYFNA